MATMQVNRNPPEPNPLPATKEELETYASQQILDCVNFFSRSNVRFGDEGLYLSLGGKVYHFIVDIQLAGEGEKPADVEF